MRRKKHRNNSFNEPCEVSEDKCLYTFKARAGEGEGGRLSMKKNKEKRNRKKQNFMRPGTMRQFRKGDKFYIPLRRRRELLECI